MIYFYSFREPQVQVKGNGFENILDEKDDLTFSQALQVSIVFFAH